MKGRILTETQIAAFATKLKSEEKSENTVEKYIRDARAFAVYTNDTEITKEVVIAYKNKLLTDNYHIAVNGQAAGPFDINTLIQMVANGQFVASSLVWKAGMSTWVKAETVDELKGLFANTMPPIPTTDN